MLISFFKKCGKTYIVLSRDHLNSHSICYIAKIEFAKF